LRTPEPIRDVFGIHSVEECTAQHDDDRAPSRVTAMRGVETRLTGYLISPVTRDEILSDHAITDEALNCQLCLAL
jgi:hypothetical protein